MSSLDHFKPFTEKHSIREAVITLFLASPIIQPERFEELINNQFKEIFQSYELLHSLEVSFAGLFKTKESFSVDRNLEVGFEFTGFDAGKKARVLRGLNESQVNKVFFSYHTLDYDRWDSFKKEFYERMSVLAEFDPGVFVKAFSIHYIDDFFWENKEQPFPNHEVFDDSYEIIPKSFLESNNATLSLATQKEINNKPYIERLDIQLLSHATHPDNPSLRISHNVTQPLSIEVKFQDFLNLDKFRIMVNQAHEHNKVILRKILKPEVQNLIALNKQ